jgi:hypothetical protein
MNDLSIGVAIAIDVFAILVYVTLVLRKIPSPLHPAWMFLGLHLYIVSLRLIQLASGGSPLKVTFAWAVAVSEVARAGVASDLGLVSIAVGMLIASAIQKNLGKFRLQRGTPLSRGRLIFCSVIALSVGTVGMVLTGHLDFSYRNAGWSTSGYLAITSSWPAWGVCIAHFLFGFTPLLLGISTVVVAMVGYFNVSRFAVIIPITLMLAIWLSRRRQRGIPWPLIASLLVLWVAWLPLKPFTGLVRDGVPILDAVSQSIDLTVESMSRDEGHIDQAYLDMIGSTMTLSDLHGSYYWGSTLLPIIYIPIPRFLWPAKPQTNEYQWELQIPSRNMAKLGMTSGLVGEGYVNFGYFGVALYCFAIGALYGTAYARSLRSGNKSPGTFLYLLLMCCSLQIYRDGLVSALFFPFVYAAPVSWGVLSHWIWKPRTPIGRRSRVPSPLGAAVGIEPSFTLQQPLGVWQNRGEVRPRKQVVHQ